MAAPLILRASNQATRCRFPLRSAAGLQLTISRASLSTTSAPHPSEEQQVPVVEMSPFLRDPSSAESKAECLKCAESFKRFGVVILRDPRFTSTHNNNFLDTMEAYFDQPYEAKIPDARPELHYQVGVTPSGQEVPMCQTDLKCIRSIERLEPDQRPLPIDGADPKWRFFWRIGDRPEHSEFAELNAEPVVPSKFPEWRQVMDGCGTLMLSAVTSCAEMSAVGFGLEKSAFSSRMELGPHLLAPTGSDLSVYNEPGTVLAGFHNDLNFMTIHGKSRYPGLYVWLREGRKIPVRIPEGCLLVQAGQQMEHLTGGVVSAGMHEVVVTPATVDALANKPEDRPAWRVSTTLFGHIASDVVLEPLPGFEVVENASYPPIKAGTQVMEVLTSIELSQSTQ